jgi:hypothetical protein
MELEEIIKCHETIIKGNPNYTLIMRDIESGAFTSKIIFEDDGNPKEVSATLDKGLVKDWYSLSELLSRSCLYEKKIVCYRSIHGPHIEQLEVKSTIPHPIPFSVSTDEEFARKWLGEKKSCCILEINVPPNTKFTAFNNKDEELILPSGDLLVTMIKYIRGKRYYVCDFIPVKYSIEGKITKLVGKYVPKHRQKI